MKNKPYIKIGDTYYPKKRELLHTENRYYGGGWLVEQIGNHYFLEYMKAALEGGCRRFEITKEIYERVREGGLDLNDIFNKYNLHHQDIPENDVTK